MQNLKKIFLIDNNFPKTGKFLILNNVSMEDEGVYICFGPMLPNNPTNMIPNTTDNTNNFNDIENLPAVNETVSEENIDQEQEFMAIQKTLLIVRTTPGPVSQLYFKASTILGFLIWRFNTTNSGGYPVRSFTAEYRSLSDTSTNISTNHEWIRMDPVNIAHNVRQMEVYHLVPNTSYEFRIWANNQLGSGEIVTTTVTTLPETKEEDLIRLLQQDLDNFDPRIWIVAVSIVLGTFVVLATGLCIVLSKECYQAAETGTDSSNTNTTSTTNANLNHHISTNVERNFDVVVIA